MTFQKSRRLKRVAAGRRQAGFSLIELVVVLAIVILLGSVAMSKVGRNNNDIASSGLAREIYSMAQQARYSALASGKQTRITLSSSNPVATYRTSLLFGNAVPSMTAATWGALEAQVNAHNSATLVGIRAGAVLPGGSMDVAPVTPSWPGGTVDLVFYPNGNAQLFLNNVAQGTLGASIFMADQNLVKRNRVLLYGRTGFSKVFSQ